ncbi:spermidine/putrescine ABC transporter substrate-binding protein [Nocardioides bigeumensis]|uniref:Spermidine/putrescine ABC transporter substrate-binding protein n=1 Tax=Nocardioides bigeumensis TaxID=433657 RepID=A0ABN2YJB6_9ACTN
MARTSNLSRRSTRRAPRRAALSVGSVVAVLALAACGGSDDEGSSAEPDELDPSADLSSQSITVSNWAGYMAEDIADQFEAATGAGLTVTEHATNEEVMAKLTAGGDSGIDVAFVSGQYAQALNDAGLLEPMHADLVPNLENLYPEATQLAFDEGNEYSVPYTWGTTGICYRSDLVDPAPTSWNDILQPDPEYAGKITMLSTERWLALPAQKALGYSVNTTDDEEIAEMADLLTSAKDSLLGYDDTTFYEKLVSGEAVMTEAWDGWCGYGMAENPDIKFVVPDEGSDLWADTMVVLKDSKNKEAAFAFINMMLEPEMHVWVTENVYYNVPNQAAAELVPAELKEQFPQLDVTPEQLAEGEVLVDLGEESTKYTELTTNVTAS